MDKEPRTHGWPSRPWPSVADVWMLTRAWLLANDMEPVAKRWPVSYRLDTMQIWEQDEGRRKLGLHIEVRDDDLMWPFCICLGPFVLDRHHYVHRAVIELCTRMGNTVAWSQWHIDAAGFPCHTSCDC